MGEEMVQATNGAHAPAAKVEVVGKTAGREVMRVRIPPRPPWMTERPGGLHFKELEGAFPLVEGYVALFHIEATEYLLELISFASVRSLFERHTSG